MGRGQRERWPYVRTLRGGWHPPCPGIRQLNIVSNSLRKQTAESVRRRIPVFRKRHSLVNVRRTYIYISSLVAAAGGRKRRGGSHAEGNRRRRPRPVFMCSRRPRQARRNERSGGWMSRSGGGGAVDGRFTRMRRNEEGEVNGKSWRVWPPPGLKGMERKRRGEWISFGSDERTD